MSPNISFCTRCSAPRRIDDIACPYCGALYEIAIPIQHPAMPAAPVKKETAATPPPVQPARDALSAFLAVDPAPGRTGECVVGLVPYVNHPNKKGFLGMDEDYGCLVLTDQRLIFTAASETLADQMQTEWEKLTEVLEKRRPKEEKNWRSLFLGWDWSNASWRSLLSQTPEQILGQDARNLSKKLDQIRYITVTLDEDDENPLDEMEVVTTSGKAEFSLDTGVGHVAALLFRRALGDRLIVK